MPLDASKTKQAAIVAPLSANKDKDPRSPLSSNNV
jgi:hypothetical protein